MHTLKKALDRSGEARFGCGAMPALGSARRVNDQDMHHLNHGISALVGEVVANACSPLECQLEELRDELSEVGRERDELLAALRLAEKEAAEQIDAAVAEQQRKYADHLFVQSTRRREGAKLNNAWSQWLHATAQEREQQKEEAAQRALQDAVAEVQAEAAEQLAVERSRMMALLARVRGGNVKRQP